MTLVEDTVIAVSPLTDERLDADRKMGWLRHPLRSEFNIPGDELHLWTVQDSEGISPGRQALRRILSLYLGIEPEHICLEEGSYGKPRIGSGHSHQDIRFSFSHSGRWAVYALTRGREIGVDIEEVIPFPLKNIDLRRVFSPGEFEAFRILPAALKEEAFYVCWTRKEALLKGAGTGLFIEPSEIEVSFMPGLKPVHIPPPGQAGTEANWSLADIELPSGYRGALAVEGSLPRVVKIGLKIQEIFQL